MLFTKNNIFDSDMAEFLRALYSKTVKNQLSAQPY